MASPVPWHGPATEGSIGFRVLAANQTPDFLLLTDSREYYLVALANLFLQVSALC